MTIDEKKLLQEARQRSRSYCRYSNVKSRGFALDDGTIVRGRERSRTPVTGSPSAPNRNAIFAA